MTVFHLRVCAVLAAFVVSACDDPAEPIDPGHIVGVEIDSAGGPIARVVTVQLDIAAPIEVTYGAAGTPVLTISSNEAVAEHRVFLPRLRADRNYVMEITVPGDPGSFLRTSLTTGPLPAEWAAMEFQDVGEPSLPVALIDVVGGTPFHGLLAVEDGEVVGYMRMAGPLFGSTRRSNGDVVLLDNALGLVIRRWDGTIVQALPQGQESASDSYGKIHHDVIATPHNTLLFIANEHRVLGSEEITGESLWEWNPETGAVVKRWSAFDHLTWHGPTPRSQPGNWLHGNGISYGPRGNVVMSLRNINQVISISPDFSAVEWKLGGVDGTLAVADEDRFYGQHFVSEPAQNRILVYDNGFQRPGGSYTRAIEYEIDVAASTATKAWEYRHTPDISAALVGSAVRLDNGHTTVLFGMREGEVSSVGPMTAVEVDEVGAVQWRLTVGLPVLSRLYRLRPVASLLGERPGSFRK